MLADPWVVLADWNMSPRSAACGKGSGSTIDFAVVKRGLERSVVLFQVHGVPWATRCGFEVSA
eukprot:1235535-Pyramimonas_sp.AAC.1